MGFVDETYDYVFSHNLHESNEYSHHVNHQEVGLIASEIAKEKNVDMIVMGSRGLGGITQFLLGSVSDRVTDHAPCPVLIVR